MMATESGANCLAVWVAVMSKGILDLCKVAIAPDGLPLLQVYREYMVAPASSETQKGLANEMGVPPALPGRQSNFENSGSVPPAVAFVFAEARCRASLGPPPLQLLLLFTGCDQAPLRGQQP
jgi:hypothetical protein